MAWNGSGVFNLIFNWENDAANGIKIRADRMDGQEQDMAANGFGNTITRDGQGSATANQPMNGFVHTGVGNATLANQYAVVGQVQNNSYLFSIAGGTSDAITAAFTPATTLTNGAQHCVRALSANATSTPTYSPDGNTAHTITKLGGNPLAVGDISGAGHELLLRYDSGTTSWELLNPSGVQVASNPNKFINGLFNVDQRNNFASISIPTSNTFFVDRWYARATGASATGQRLTGNIVPTGTQYKFTGASGVTGMIIGYRAESADCLDIQQATSTVSFTLYGAANQISNMVFTISSPNAVDNFTATTVRQTINLTMNTATSGTFVSFNVAGNANYANGFQIEMNLNQPLGIVGNSFSISAPKWEAGSNATPVQLDEPVAFTLAKCQRYFQAYTYAANSFIALGNSFSTTNAFCAVRYPPMRAAPTVTLPAGGTSAGQAGFRKSDASNPTTFGSHALTVSTATGDLRIDGSGYVGLTAAGISGFLVSISAAMTLSAEL